MKSRSTVFIAQRLTVLPLLFLTPLCASADSAPPATPRNFRNVSSRLIISEDFQNGRFNSIWTTTDVDRRHYSPTTSASLFANSPSVSASHSLHYRVLGGTDERIPANLFYAVPTGIREFYIEWQEYFEADYPFPHGQKMMRFTREDPITGSRTGGIEAEIAVIAQGTNIQLRWFRFGGGGEQFINTHIPMPTNRWVKFAVWGKLNDLGQANGHLRAWMDDQPIASLDNQQMIVENKPWTQMTIGMNYSNRGVGLPRSSSRFIDQIRWYSTRP